MFFISMSLLSLAYKRKCSLISSKISEQVREQVSDRPARTPGVVLAVSSHDSLRVTFFFYLKSVLLRVLLLLYDSIRGFKEIIFSKG